MVAQSGVRLKVFDPAAWVRCDNGLIQELTLDRLRLADFAGSVALPQVRSRHGQAHYSGEYASATTGGFVVYGSRLELARLLADFDPKVWRVYAQPFRLVGRMSGLPERGDTDTLAERAKGAVFSLKTCVFLVDDLHFLAPSRADGHLAAAVVVRLPVHQEAPHAR